MNGPGRLTVVIRKAGTYTNTHSFIVCKQEKICGQISVCVCVCVCVASRSLHEECVIMAPMAYGGGQISHVGVSTHLSFKCPHWPRWGPSDMELKPDEQWMVRIIFGLKGTTAPPPRSHIRTSAVHLFPANTDV